MGPVQLVPGSREEGPLLLSFPSVQHGRNGHGKETGSPAEWHARREWVGMGSWLGRQQHSDDGRSHRRKKRVAVAAGRKGDTARTQVELQRIFDWSRCVRVAWRAVLPCAYSNVHTLPTFTYRDTVRGDAGRPTVHGSDPHGTRAGKSVPNSRARVRQTEFQANGVAMPARSLQHESGGQRRASRRSVGRSQFAAITVDCPGCTYLLYARTIRSSLSRRSQHLAFSFAGDTVCSISGRSWRLLSGRWRADQNCSSEPESWTALPSEDPFPQAWSFVRWPRHQALYVRYCTHRWPPASPGNAGRPDGTSSIILGRRPSVSQGAGGHPHSGSSTCRSCHRAHKEAHEAQDQATRGAHVCCMYCMYASSATGIESKRSAVPSGPWARPAHARPCAVDLTPGSRETSAGAPPPSRDARTTPTVDRGASQPSTSRCLTEIARLLRLPNALALAYLHEHRPADPLARSIDRPRFGCPRGDCRPALTAAASPGAKGRMDHGPSNQQGRSSAPRLQIRIPGPFRPGSHRRPSSECLHVRWAYRDHLPCSLQPGGIEAVVAFHHCATIGDSDPVTHQRVASTSTGCRLTRAPSPCIEPHTFQQTPGRTSHTTVQLWSVFQAFSRAFLSAPSPRSQTCSARRRQD
nr:hypothetical protein CFP56_12086 [Quercus suber]